MDPHSKATASTAGFQSSNATDQSPPPRDPYARVYHLPKGTVRPTRIRTTVRTRARTTSTRSSQPVKVLKKHATPNKSITRISQPVKGIHQSPVTKNSTASKGRSYQPKSGAFTCFMALPLEIRLIIWRFAQPRRYLELHNTMISKLTGRGKTPGAILLQPLRILNAVNKESRYETQRNYLTLPRSATVASHISFNETLDTLYIGDSGTGLIYIPAWNDLIKGLRAAGSSVTRLLVNIEMGSPERSEEEAEVFLSMKEVVFVVGTGTTEREKIITPKNIHIGGGGWGTGNTVLKRKQTKELLELMDDMKFFADRDHEGKMPIVKVMRMAST